MRNDLYLVRSGRSGKFLAMEMHLDSFSSPVWRLLPNALVNTPCAFTPEDGFHHSGQAAAYVSLSEEGANVAIQRCLSDGAGPALIPMWLDAKAVADVHRNVSVSVIWQELRNNGDRSQLGRSSMFQGELACKQYYMAILVFSVSQTSH